MALGRRLDAQCARLEPIDLGQLFPGACAQTHRCRLAPSTRRGREQLTWWGALQKGIVHSKRQLALSTGSTCNERIHAQRVVEVGRVHLRTLPISTRPQTRHRLTVATPRLRERAVARPIVQPRRVEYSIERTQADARHAVAAAVACVVHTPKRTRLGRAGSARAVHRRRRCHGQCPRSAFIAAHLKASAGYRALDVQPRRLSREWRYEEDAMQRGCCRRA